MPSSFSVTDTMLWPTLGDVIVEASRPKHISRETVGPGALMRTFDRAGGMDTSGPVSLEQRIYGGMVEGAYLDTIASGTFGPRDSVSMNHGLVSGVLTIHGGGALVDTVV